MLWRSHRTIGLKTGWTQAAGPCLCSALRVPVTNTERARTVKKGHKKTAKKKYDSDGDDAKDDVSGDDEVHIGVEEAVQDQREEFADENCNQVANGSLRGKKLPRVKVARQFREVLVVTLDSTSTVVRWQEHRRLYRWVINYYKTL